MYQDRASEVATNRYRQTGRLSAVLLRWPHQHRETWDIGEVVRVEADQGCPVHQSLSFPPSSFPLKDRQPLEENGPV